MPSSVPARNGAVGSPSQLLRFPSAVKRDPAIHVNVGFFRGAEIADPERLLEGTGKFMRHVKLRPEGDVDATALMSLIGTAYADMKGRLKAE